ncbi:MAG: DUF1501 domain-containing protein [Verrucomicrobia bacterium]|nr:DUF1501 domain-containing protein [Verrucomicrobiota bacterium]
MTGKHCSDYAKLITRRHFFAKSATGIGTIALASLLNEKLFATTHKPAPHDPLSIKPPHFAPRAKRVIYLFMYGAPSQLDLFDFKPKLKELTGKPVPEDMIKGQRFAFLKGIPNLVGTPFEFARHGKSGAELSELLPYTAQMADNIAIVRSMHTDAFNHDPATTFINTGSTFMGRPSIGAWLTYGLGSVARDLPGFVVLVSGNGAQPLGTHHWGSGFLPTTYQGVQFRSQGDPVLFVSNPEGVSDKVRRQSLNAVRDLNSLEHEAIGDPEILTRINSFEMAYRMQTSVPELMDISSEPKKVQEEYGVEPGKATFANNCLLARRLVERGVRFVQLFHRDWDHHGGNGDQNLLKGLPERCRQTDRPAAALVKDLKQRGLLDDTLVIWGGEFGRTPMLQGEVTKTVMGRDHHPRAYSIWMAGGGIKPGITFGATDELGYNVTENPVHIHDFQATVLHLLGLDHTKLTYRFQGRDFRLTDVHGEVVAGLLV